MSLINQMLRDLEQRRKTGERQLPRHQPPVVQLSRSRYRRPILWLLAGLLLLAAIVSGIGLLLRPQPAPSSLSEARLPEDGGQRLAISGQRSEPTSAAERPATPKKVVQTSSQSNDTSQSVTPKTVASDNSKPAETPVVSAAVAKPEATKTTPVVKPPPEKPVDSPAGVKTTLLKIGILEAVTSSRLMLDFESIPDYSWRFIGENKRQLEIRLKNTSPQPAFKRPPMRGRLLTEFQVQQDRQDLLLLVELSQPAEPQALELQADHLHGPRLLIEFIRLTQSAQVTAQPTSSSQAAAVSSDHKKVLAPDQQTEKNTGLVTKTAANSSTDHAYQQALKQLRRKEYLLAEKTLQHVLTLDPRMLEARLQLIALLQQLERPEEAEGYLLEGLQMHPNSFALRKLYARRLMDTGHLLGAINILQSAPRPEITEDLEYYALLAALLQEDGQHQSAVKAYRQLLEYRPHEVLWWLGLGISLEKSGDAVNAQQAYQEAVTLPGLRQDLKEYARKRLRSLAD